MLIREVFIYFLQHFSKSRRHWTA